MGRRRDNPEDQEAKGFPGKRKSKVEKMLAQAAERARLLASLPPETAAPLAPPAFIDDPMYAEAVAIWKVLVPELQENNFFNPTLDRFTFAAYCLVQAEYFAADRSVREKGHWFMRKAIAGGMRPWVNPDVDRRDAALKMAMELAREFALTPTARSKLERIHSAMSDGPLFRRRADADAETGGGETSVPEEDDAIGIVDRLRSTPPVPRPN
jgi:phage terminase small subunit